MTISDEDLQRAGFRRSTGGTHSKGQQGNGASGSTDAQPPNGRRSISFIWFKDAVLDSLAEWLVKGILPARGFIEIYGKPGCGKSFLALTLALAIARGILFFGRKVVSPGLVVYIAAEGGHGVIKRLVAYKDHHEPENADAPFALVPEPLDLRNAKTGDLTALIEELKQRVAERGLPLVAVFVDTLNRAFGGGNENAPEDMGAFIQNCDRIRRATEAAVIVVHHEGKDPKGKGGRGHSSLIAATDAVLFVEEHEDGSHSFTIERQKDGEAGETFGFRFDQFVLGEDEDADPITSLVVEPTDEVPTKARLTPVSGKKAEALQVLDNLLASGAGKTIPATTHIPDGVHVVDLDLWHRTCAMSDLLDGKNPRQQWSDIKAGLKAAGRIGIWNKQVWRVKL